jgi:hypothetical protein
MEQVLNAERQDCLMNSIIHSADLAYRVMAEEAGAPHVLMRPKLSIDGNQWCALYGDNLQDGVTGFGDSPQKAMKDFDKNWWASLPGSEEVKP